MTSPSSVRWKVGPLLARYNRSAYALIKASGLAPGTVYAIARGEGQAVQFETLTAILAGLEKLTGEAVEVGDVLEVAREPVPIPDEALELAALAAVGEGAALAVTDCLAEFEADQDPDERRGWLEAARRASQPARYVPGQGFLADGEA